MAVIVVNTLMMQMLLTLFKHIGHTDVLRFKLLVILSIYTTRKHTLFKTHLTNKHNLNHDDLADTSENVKFISKSLKVLKNRFLTKQ